MTRAKPGSAGPGIWCPPSLVATMVVGTATIRISVSNANPNTPIRRWRSTRPMVTNKTWTTNNAIHAVMRAPCTCTSTVNGWDSAEKSLEKYDGQNPATTNAQMAIAADTYIPRSSDFQLA